MLTDNIFTSNGLLFKQFSVLTESFFLIVEHKNRSYASKSEILHQISE